jgi:transposase-like protein
MRQKSSDACAGNGVSRDRRAGASTRPTSKFRGQWAYLYRAVDKFGDTIDFYLSPTRNTAAAKRFLSKALNGLKQWELPHVVNTDKAPTYAAALAELKKEGKCPEDTIHRQAKYLNNVVEADHGKLKQLIRPVRGFKTLKTAYATIKGFEVMRALRKGQAGAFNLTHNICGEVRLIERAFGLGACVLTEAIEIFHSSVSLMVNAGTPHGAVPVSYRARHEQVPLCPRCIAIHIDLAVQAVMNGEREDPRSSPEKTSDRVPALEPPQARAVPDRILCEERGDPISVIVVVAQGGVA